MGLSHGGHPSSCGGDGLGVRRGKSLVFGFHRFHPSYLTNISFRKSLVFGFHRFHPSYLTNISFRKILVLGFQFFQIKTPNQPY
jgi:hypothetical protein